MKTRILCCCGAVLLAAATGTVLVVGCVGDMSGMSGGEYEISLLTPRHFHAFTTTDTLFFKVTNKDGEPKAGLSPTLSRRLKGSQVIDTTMKGELTDNHDGVYYLKTTFHGAGFYALTFSFERDGMTYSNAFPFEATFAGGEAIYCPDAASATHNYQVRWNAVPGLMFSGDSVEFLIEPKRCFAQTVNTTQPWTNPFNHLLPQDLVPAGSLPVVKIGTAMGEHALTVTYKGLGIYSAKALVPQSSAMDTAWLHVSFQDSCGTIDEDGATDRNYRFAIMSRGTQMQM